MGNEIDDEKLTPGQKASARALEREAKVPFHPTITAIYAAKDQDTTPAEIVVTENPFLERREQIITEVASARNSLRRSGRVEPMRGRLLVARVTFDEAIGSIFIPEEITRAKSQLNEEAVVLSCGQPRIDDRGVEMPMDVQPGDHIIIRPHAGLLFDWWHEGKKYECYLIAQAEVIAKLHPTPGYRPTPDLAATLLALNPAPPESTE